MTRVAKAPPSDKRGGKPLLVCAKAKAGGGCAYKSVRQELVERSIIQDLPRYPSFDPYPEGTIGDLVSDIDEQNITIANLVKQASISPSEAISERLEEEEATKRELDERIDMLLYQHSPLVQQGVTKAMDRLTAVLECNPIDMPLANAIMRQLFSEVLIDPVKGELLMRWRAVPEVCAQVLLR